MVLSRILVTLTLTLIMLVPAGSVLAQNETDAIQAIRAQINANRKALVAANLGLTEEESQVFWPLYREFHAEKAGLMDQRMAILLDFRDNFDMLTDEKSAQIIEDYFRFEKDLLKLRRDYAKKFTRAIPAKKTLRYLQMENKMDDIVEFELAQIVPLAE